MYDRHLETFLQAADCGSFLKAAEKLYISANAVTKQINLLEDRLEVKLFRRSTQGLELTEAGRLIYAEAKKMIRHTNTVLRRARELERAREAVIRVGVSLMNPPSLLLEYWGRVSGAYPNLKLEVIPFEDTAPAFSEVLDHLGEKIDLIPCPYQTDYWGDRYQSFHLCDLPLRVACAQTHPLAARREPLTLPDLRGQTILLTRKGEGTERLARLLEDTGDVRVERGAPHAGHPAGGLGLHRALRAHLRQGPAPAGAGVPHGGGRRGGDRRLTAGFPVPDETKNRHPRPHLRPGMPQTL